MIVSPHKKLTKKLEKEILQYCTDNPLEMYWDYRDQLNIEDCQKVIDGNLLDVENDVYEMNMEYTWEMEREYFKELADHFDLYDPESEEWILKTDEDDFKEMIRENTGVNMNIKKLLDNTTVRMRIVLHANVEGASYTERGNGDFSDSEYIQMLKGALKGKYDPASFQQELDNICSCCNQFIFYGNVNMGDICGMDFEKWSEITIKDAWGGFFDACSGSGSVLETKFTAPITLKRQWGEHEYDSVSILIDEANKYSVEEVYGLCNVPDLNFDLK